MARNRETYTPLPPERIPIPVDGAHYDRDAVSGFSVPPQYQIVHKGQLRDGRYPRRLDKPGFPLPLTQPEIDSEPEG